MFEFHTNSNRRILGTLLYICLVTALAKICLLNRRTCLKSCNGIVFNLGLYRSVVMQVSVFLMSMFSLDTNLVLSF